MKKDTDSVQTPMKLMSEREVAKEIGFSVFWLQRSRVVGGGPPYIKLGRSVRYPVANLVQWLSSQPLRHSTSAMEA
jgi:predicted DNA-binding transcriptional regulator AlpA